MAKTPPRSIQAKRLTEKPGREGNTEAAVAVEQRGIRSVKHDALLMCDKHRDPGAVLAFIEDLLHHSYSSGSKATCARR